MVAKFISASAAAATGAHSTSSVSVSGSAYTLCFWYKLNTDNSLNTLWAGDAGQFQLFSGSGGQERLSFRANGSTSVLFDVAASYVGTWCWVVCRAGANHSGTDDITIEIWDDSGNQLDSDGAGSSISSELSDGGTHWFLGDDNSGGTNTDDGFEGEIFDFCFFEGIISNADLPYDTTTGEAQPTLSSAASAGVVYRLRGENSSDRLEDNSGNGNDFTNEGGVTFSETDLPPIASGGGSTVSGDGSSSGTSTVSGQGQATTTADGSSTGAATASGSGESTAEADGSSDGSSTASGQGQVGGTVQEGDGSSDGSSTASGDGSATSSADGAASGSASAVGEGAATAEGQGTAAGSSTASGGGVVSELVSYPEGDAGSAEFEGSLDAGWTLQPGTAIPAFNGWSVVDGKLRCTFTAGQNCDPGTGSTTSGLGAPRVETPVADTDFDCYVQLRADPRLYTSAFNGYGFVLRGASASGRLDIYAKDGTETTQAYVKLGSSTISSTAPPDNFPAFLHLNRTGDTFELRTSKDGTNWDLVASGTWVETITHVGVSCWQINDGGDPATLEIESIHLGQAALPVLNGEGERTTVAAPALNDLTGLVDASSGGGSISASGGVLTMTCTVPDQSTARFTLSVGDVQEDQGVLFRCQNAGTTSTSTYFGAVLRGQPKGAVDWAGQYAPPTALVFEGNPRTDLARLLHTAGANASNADGANWSYNYSDNDSAMDMQTGWVWVRMEAIGPFLRYRAWADGDQEPATWTAEVNNTLIEGAGKIGIGYSKNDATGASGSMEVADLEAYTITASASVVSEGDGAAAGSGTADAIGEATVEAIGTSDGSSSASGAGEATAEGDGGSAGSSSASGEGSDATENVGQSTGSSTAAGQGEATATADGSSDGSGTASGEGESTAEGAGSSAGGSTASGQNTTDGVPVAEVPSERTMTIAAESRTYEIPEENRTLKVA